MNKEKKGSRGQERCTLGWTFSNCSLNKGVNCNTVLDWKRIKTQYLSDAQSRVEDLSEELKVEFSRKWLLDVHIYPQQRSKERMVGGF